MGNMKKKGAPGAVPASQTKAWWDARNARRRAKYENDSEYRASVVSQARSSYRRIHGNEDATGRVEQNLPRIQEYGVVRGVIMPDGSSTDLHCLYASEVAEFIGRNIQVFYRWRRDGKWPWPFCWTRDPEKRHRWTAVYLLPEVEACAMAYAEHEKETRYYQLPHHQKVRDSVFVAALDARRKMGIVHDIDDLTSNQPPPAGG